jgi:hypothetical protein
MELNIHNQKSVVSKTPIKKFLIGLYILYFGSCFSNVGLTLFNSSCVTKR